MFLKTHKSDFKVMLFLYIFWCDFDIINGLNMPFIVDIMRGLCQ